MATIRWAASCGMIMLMLGAALAQPKPGAPASPAPAPKPAVATAPQPPAPAWDGRWSGIFGARTDMAVTIADGKVTAVTLLGQPLTITASIVTPQSVSASGPDFRIDIARFTATAGQGIYENNRKEKAVAAFSKN